jgi:hypothetical protein
MTESAWDQSSVVLVVLENSEWTQPLFPQQASQPDSPHWTYRRKVIDVQIDAPWIPSVWFWAGLPFFFSFFLQLQPHYLQDRGGVSTQQQFVYEIMGSMMAATPASYWQRGWNIWDPWDYHRNSNTGGEKVNGDAKLLEIVG